jgi:hypothetical protein
MFWIFTSFVTAFGPLSDIKEWMRMMLLERGGGGEGLNEILL